MSSLIELLNTASIQVNIYVGITFFLFGLIGNIMNILIFSSLLKITVFPASPFRLYILISAIANLVFVCYLLLTRILMSGFLISITNTINFMCKSRFYIGQISMYTSLYCTCLATIDQYFLTNRSIKIRQLSNISYTKLILLLSIILWCLINLPILFLYNVYPKPNSSSTICTVYSSIWSFYYTYIQSLIFLCILPLSIYILFAILTRKNLQLIQKLNRSSSRQMIQIVFAQGIGMTLSLLIATVQIIYQQITMNIQKDTLRNAQDNMFNTVANLLTYVTYFGDFYIYLCSSKILRQTLKNIIFNRQQIQTVRTVTMFSTQNQQFIQTYHNKVRPTCKDNN